MTNIDQMADVFLPEPRATDDSEWGIVRAINPDGSYQVQLRGSSALTRCANYCTAVVGDRVHVIIKKNGLCEVIGRHGGTLGGGGTIVTQYDDASNYIAGRVFAYAGTDEPIGALLCDGRAVSRTTYWELFDAIGTTYGAGDGSTTFNLPNIESRTIIGESDSYALGSTGGKETVTLSAAIGACSNNASSLAYIAEPYNGYQIGNAPTYAVAGTGISYTGWNHSTPVTEQSSQSRYTNIMQPYIVMRYFITTGKGDPVSGINPADYLVDWKRDDNGWDWEKWASGRAFCRRKYSHYTETYGASNFSLDYPIKFSEPPETDVTPNDGAGWLHSEYQPYNYANDSTDHMSVQFYIQQNSYMPMSLGFDVEVSGWWKDSPASGGTESIAPTIESRFQGIEADIDLLKTNKVLWSGVSYMEDWATATLSEPVSAQPNGIVLVWSYYNNGAAVDDIWTTHPISKEFVAKHEGNGYSAGAITAAGPYLKHVYIADTTIRGWANNSVTGTTGNVTVYNNYFVLRYVLGV